MITRLLTAALLIPLVVGSLFWSPLWVFLLLGSLFLGAAVWEFQQVSRHYWARPILAAYPLALALPWVWNYYPAQKVSYLVLAGFLLLISALTVRAETRVMFLSACLALLGFFYLAIPFALIGSMHPEASRTGSGYDLLVVLTAVWVCDSAAYFVGRSFGKRRITPHISPAKSLEGFVGGFVFSFAFVMYAGIQWLEWSWPISFWLALLLPLATIFGDLFESTLKRGAGVKDTSHLIPGHGGVLDRIDSLLFALPVHFLVTSLLP